MEGNDAIQAAAEWMLLELEADGRVSREYATEHLATRFGETAVHGELRRWSRDRPEGHRSFQQVGRGEDRALTRVRG